eukprot:gene5147-274_t
MLHLAVTNAIPLSDSDDVENYESNALDMRTLESDNAYKRQFGYHGPSMDEFDAYGHHLHSHGHMDHVDTHGDMGYGGMHGHMGHGGVHGHMAHAPQIVHHHEYQFHAPDIDYWWPHHWPHHLPPPFPFHKKEDDKKKDKDKRKEDDKKKEEDKKKEKDKKKGKKSRK